MSPEFPGRGRAGLWLRFLAAAAVVVVLSAAVTATAGLNAVQGFVNDLKRGGTINGLGGVITRAQAGDPQTILLIGSDHRANAGKHDARSDTMILVRLDPDANATTVLSIPRDLRVTFTYRGVVHGGAKINETYTDGGEALTAKVIEQLLPGVQINHVVNVDFKGFKAAVNAMGCVYADVDHRYYHSNLGVPAGQQYAEIDISAGYQRLCGEQALDYVRYRHTDNDFVRAARQQDFLRQVKSQYGASRFISDPHAITSQVGRYVRTDASLQSKEELLKLATLVAFSASHPIREVHFPPAYLNVPGGASYVVASQAALAQVQHEFLSPPPQEDKRTGGGHRSHGRRHRPAGPSTAGLVDAGSTGESYAIRLGGLPFPVYYPKLLTGRGQYMPPLQGEYPRAYRIRDAQGHVHWAYRLVISEGEDGNYYGVQGTSWTDPPILKNPSADRRVVNGKRLLLFYDGTSLRLVAWRAPGAVYWISNTLQEKLTNDQMLAIAGSLTRLGH